MTTFESVRWLAGAIHPAQLVVSLVRDEGWFTDAGGVEPLDDDSSYVLMFHDGEGHEVVASREEYLEALAQLCDERGAPADSRFVRAVLADASVARSHPGADLEHSARRCERLAKLLERHGWTRTSADEIVHLASGSTRNVRYWNEHVEAERAALAEPRVYRVLPPAWIAYRQSMLGAIDELLAEERARYLV